MEGVTSTRGDHSTFLVHRKEGVGGFEDDVEGCSGCAFVAYSPSFRRWRSASGQAWRFSSCTPLARSSALSYREVERARAWLVNGRSGPLPCLSGRVVTRRAVACAVLSLSFDPCLCVPAGLHEKWLPLQVADGGKETIRWLLAYQFVRRFKAGVMDGDGPRRDACGA